MFTGVPVRVSSDPALAAKASGMSSFDGTIPARTATTTTTGSSAATAPLIEMNAASTAAIAPITTVSRTRARPARVTTCWPSQAVTPVASSDSLTTNRLAMKSTVGSPKPASDSLSVSTPVAQRASATPSETIASGTRPVMKAMTARPRIRNVHPAGSMGRA